MIVDERDDEVQLDVRRVEPARVFRKPPPSAKFDVSMPRRSRRKRASSRSAQPPPTDTPIVSTLRVR